MNMYRKFFFMIATSTVIMFVLMYLNTYELDYVCFSETRAYMALIMGATLAAIMQVFMLGMFHVWIINTLIFIGSTLTLWSTAVASA